MQSSKNVLMKDDFALGGSKSGVAIIYIIIGIVIFGMMGAGIVSFVSTSSMSTAEPDCARRARYIAESGIRYAMSEVRSAVDSDDTTLVLADMDGKTYTLDDKSSFTLTFTDNRPDFTVRSVGKSCEEFSPTEVAVEYSFNAPNSSNGSGGPITSDDDSKDFSTVVDPGKPAVGIEEDAEGNITVVFGNGKYSTFGCHWYKGNKPPCKDGGCVLGTGLRTYFVLEFDKQAYGDGLTFTIKSAITNALQSCGGSGGRGELLAYGGGGFDGKGISSPKIGTEFDIHYNGDRDPCRSSSRNDDRNKFDHVAFIYWGQEGDFCGSEPNLDDNRHQAGADTSTEPRNSYNWDDSGVGTDGYFYRNYRDWLKRGYNEDRKTVARVELHRSQTPNAAGYYVYSLRGWIRQAIDAMEPDYKDVTKDFMVKPDFVDVIALRKDVHDEMDTVYWGWTASTGGATQAVVMEEWKLAFRGEEASTPATWDNQVPDDYTLGWTLDEGVGFSVEAERTGSLWPGAIMPRTQDPEFLEHAEWVAGIPASGGAGVRTGRFVRNRRPGHIIIPHDPAMSLTPRGSVSLWFNPNELRSRDNRYGLVRKGNPTFEIGFPDYRLRLIRSGGNRFTLEGTVTLTSLGFEWPFSVASGTILQNRPEDVDQWHHAVLTWENHILRLYLDGRLEDAYASPWGTGVARSSNEPLIISATRARSGDRSNNYCLDGVIDQIFLFDRELTLDEIQTIYRAGLL